MRYELARAGRERHTGAHERGEVAIGAQRDQRERRLIGRDRVVAERAPHDIARRRLPAS